MATKLYIFFKSNIFPFRITKNTSLPNVTVKGYVPGFVTSPPQQPRNYYQSFVISHSFWKCNFLMNHHVCLSVGPSVQKQFVRIFQMSKFLVNVVFFYFDLKTPPLPFAQLPIKFLPTILVRSWNIPHSSLSALETE